MRLTVEFRRLFVVTAAVLSLAFVHNAARAQEWNTLEEAQALKPGSDHFIFGVGAAYAPAYEGADKYRVVPLPALDVTWGPFFANLHNGFGINIIDTERFTVGTSIMVMPGYRGKDVPRGIGDLSTGVGGRAFASFKAAGLIGTIGATKGVAGGTKGLVADASLSYPFRLGGRFMLIPTVGTTWADAKYNNRYFGVSAEQSFASGLAQFEPGQGFKNASALLTASYRLTDRLSISASAGATTLLDNVKDSPIVVHRNAQPTGFLSLSYRFGH